MKQRIIAYTKRIDSCISGETPVENWEELLEEHIHQLEWFQHERIVHMFVMLTFAIMTVATIITELVTEFYPLLAAIFLFMVLLVPYIKHYYILENGVQTLYVLYEEITRRTMKGDLACIPEEFGIKLEPFNNEKNK